MKTVILLGSESDRRHAVQITDVLDDFGIPSEVIVASAHKVPENVIKIIDKNNAYVGPLCYVTIAGRSNGLSGVVAGSTIHPVIASPPFSDQADYLVNIHSTLQMPKETPVMAVLEPLNAALCAARIFGLNNAEIRQKVEDRITRVKAAYAERST